jgi:hypothetical protein
MTLTLHLQIAGLLQLLLALVHFDFVRRFGWREELARVSLLTRQVFWVHTGFIVLVVAGFGALSLVCAEALSVRSTLARAVLGGLALFWLARWFCQFFVYSPSLWRGHRRRTLAHVSFSLLWSYLAGVYAVAFAHQFPFISLLSSPS